MPNLHELDARLGAVLNELEDCVELSIMLREYNPKEVDNRWQQFLGQFLQYVRKRENETGQSLLKGISLASLFKFW